MKKIKLLLISILTLLLFPNIVNAASGTISISGNSTVVKGNKITITVTLSSGTSIGSWQMDLNYDKSYLELVGSSAEAGGTAMVNSSSGTKSKSYTFSFKALKSGSTSLSVNSYTVYAYDDMSQMDISSNKKTIRIMTQEELQATYSKDNNLKSLSIEGFELNEKFDKDVVNYSVNVPTGTTSVKINATKNDSKASVSGAGEVTVTEGLNSIPITVTAENGSEKTYTIVINVEDLNPINVKIDNETYSLVKTASLLTPPDTFSETKVMIDNIEIPAFINTNANITLVGLKDKDGNIIYAIYDKDKYTIYNEMKLKTYLLIPTTFTKELDLEKTTVTINNEKVDAYKINDNLVIISAKSLEDGKTNLYLYDIKENTSILYDNSLLNNKNNEINNYKYIIYGLLGLTGLLLIIILSVTHKLRKNERKVDKFVKKQEAKLEATRKLNDVVDAVKEIEKKEQKDNKEIKKEENKEIEIKKIEKDDSDEIYDLFADDKKKKKK